MSQRPASSTQRARRIILAAWVWLLALCSSMPQPAQAQFVVSDPTNLIQNTTSAVSEVQSTVQLIRSVQNQVEQIKQAKQNLEKLEVENLSDLLELVDQISSLVGRTARLAQTWVTIYERFDEFYGDREPPVVPAHDAQSRNDYFELASSWEAQTDEAYREQLGTQADVARLHAPLNDEAEALKRQSKNVRGEVAATELNTEIAGVMARQNALMLDLELKRAQSENAARLEKRRKAQAQQKWSLDRMGRGFGDWESTAPPVELAPIPTTGPMGGW